MKTKRGLAKKQQAEKLWSGRRAEILWLYNNQNWSQAQVASYYDVSQTAITKVLRRLGVASNGRGRRGMLNGRYKDGTASTAYRQMIEKDKCETCGATDNLVVHHKNGDHQDNHLKNLQILCDSCHNRHHRRLWWRKRKSSA